MPILRKPDPASPKEGFLLTIVSKRAKGSRASAPAGAQRHASRKPRPKQPPTLENQLPTALMGLRAILSHCLCRYVKILRGHLTATLVAPFSAPMHLTGSHGSVRFD